MIWNGRWTIDKGDTDKEIVEVKDGATEIDRECWIHEEADVPLYPGSLAVTSIYTKAKFTKLIVPESVVKISERALYRCETVREISVLSNVTAIGKEAFKGCNGLSAVVAPLIKVTEIEDSDTKMKLAFGYCLNEELYSEEVAGDYLKYLKSQKSRLLQNAEKFKLPEVTEFLAEKGIVTSVKGDKKGSTTKAAAKKKKISALDAVLLLEKTVLTGETAEISAVINEYKPFDTMSRALGLACRCRSTDIVEILVKHKATFAFDPKIASRYGFNCKQSGKVVQAKFQMLPVVKNIWNEYLFGSFDKHYAKEKAKSEYSEIIGSDVDFSEIPEEMKMGPVEDRLSNIRFLSGKKIIKQDDINSMLYYSILEKEYTIAKELEEMGAVIDVPWLVADADHSRTISEINQYLDAMCRFEKDDRIKVLNKYSSLLEKNGRKMYVNENVWDWLEAGKEEEIARALLRNGDTSSINKTGFLKSRLSRISPESLSVLIENGFITSTRLRDELIESSVTNKLTEIAALLLEYKNKTADLAKEEVKKREKDLKELNASPDSAYELKKNWISKKKDDGTLVITAYKGSMTDVVVPSKIGNAVVTEIGEEAFSPDAKRIKNADVRREITRIVIPDTVETIGNSAFAYCKKLKEVILPDSISTFGTRVFSRCESITELTIPSNTKGKLSWYFFSDCKSLKTVFIPGGVTEITEWSFWGCDNLTELHCKKELKSFDFSSIEKCKNVTIYAPDGSYAQKFAKEHKIKYICE